MYAQEEIKPYNASVPKGKQVEQMFDGIAPSYDLLNHVLSLGIDRRWRDRTIDALSVFDHNDILDVATGTGDFALLTYKRLKPNRLIACDISERMMDIGRKKIVEAGVDKFISFQRENCLHLSFKDESFDIVTVAYGVRNFANLDKGLREMLRVLRKGGHLAILELCTPHKFPIRQLFWLYAHIWMPLIGRIVSGDVHAYTYLPATMEAFPQGEIMKEILQKAGYSEVSFKRFTFGLSTMYLATR